MPTKPYPPLDLTGEAAALAGLPRADTPRGGVESDLTGMSAPAVSAPEQQPDAEVQSFPGLGPFLEDDDRTVFETVHGLVQRQEVLARNHLACDSHWLSVKLGFPWSVLTRNLKTGVWTHTYPKGTTALRTQAIPNEAWDLVNKATETLLVDEPKPHAQPLRDEDQARWSANVCEKFLTEQQGEKGVDESNLFYQAVDRSLTCATAYLHAWVDTTGGGYIPLQIQAHPAAVDPENALVNPADGMPSSDLMLRYVTPPNPETGARQFTTDAGQAAPQWQPRLVGDLLCREHVRVFPETATVNRAEKVVLLWYCTLGEAKRRWPVVAAMGDQAATLCDWQPERFLALLPPAQQIRWKLTAGSEKDKGGAGDERLVFFYIVYQRALPPDYPQGAMVIVNGTDGGFLFERRPMAITLEPDEPEPAQQQPEAMEGAMQPGESPDDQQQGEQAPDAPPAAVQAASHPAVKCFEIPLVAITPRVDADERDPQGRAFIELFGGATEWNAHLAMGYAEAMDQILHIEKYAPSTSPVEGWQIAEARLTNDVIPILRAEDVPKPGPIPTLPTGMLDVIQYGRTTVEGIASLNKPVTGANDQQEVSGKARQIAVQQAMVGLSRMQVPVNNARQRWWRILTELAMTFDTPQMLRYVGEDGAYQVDEWRGTDFALVGDIAIKPGTGTMRTPESKVNYTVSLLQIPGVLNPDDAIDAIRPAYAAAIGLPEDDHNQAIERAVAAWLKGPPQGWGQLNAAYQQQLAGYQATMQQYQAGVARIQQLAPQAEQASQESGDVPPAMPPIPPPPQAPTPPWTPFAPRVIDTEPEIAKRWTRRLSKLIATTSYSGQPPEWRALVDQKYTQSRQVLMMAQQAAQAVQAAPQQGAPQRPGQPGQQRPQQDQHAATPAPPKQPASNQPAGVAG